MLMVSLIVKEQTCFQKNIHRGATLDKFYYGPNKEKYLLSL